MHLWVCRYVSNGSVLISPTPSGKGLNFLPEISLVPSQATLLALSRKAQRIPTHVHFVRVACLGNSPLLEVKSVLGVPVFYSRIMKLPTRPAVCIHRPFPHQPPQFLSTSMSLVVIALTRHQIRHHFDPRMMQSPTSVPPLFIDIGPQLFICQQRVKRHNAMVEMNSPSVHFVGAAVPL